MDATLYDELEVSPAASTAVIEAAYRRLARDAHPDAGGDPQRMAELNTARDVLTDPERRAAYDGGLAGDPEPDPPNSRTAPRRPVSSWLARLPRRVVAPLYALVLGYSALSHGPRVVWVPLAAVAGLLFGVLTARRSPSCSRFAWLLVATGVVWLADGLFQLAEIAVSIVLIWTVVRVVRRRAVNRLTSRS